MQGVLAILYIVARGCSITAILAIIGTDLRIRNHAYRVQQHHTNCAHS